MASRCCFLRPNVFPAPSSDRIISALAELERSFVPENVVLIN